MSMDVLCLDGPLNGLYASLDDPPEDYEQMIWPTGEVVLVHAVSTHLVKEEVEDGVYDRV